MLVDSIPPGPDTFSILLTTDNHVGYNEDDPIRGDDGWKTWDEITALAVDRDVDMIVQGGDLFHINKPTKKSLYHVMKSIRAHCMGDRPVEMELLSDPATHFSHGFNNVNYEDPNLNVGTPIFAISGNHDDATGDGLLSPLDVLAISGLINHFGKVANNEDITVSPILFQKGSTKLALYGMQNVRDERLHRAFRDGQVKFQRPMQQTDDWFNLFCIHQNHVQHSVTSHIPEHFLPSFLDFVLWGHEHECVPVPVHNPEMGFDVLQAGSSIATSLSEGEIPEKHVFLLNIRGRDYSCTPIALSSVRPFIMKHIVLMDTGIAPGPASKSAVVEYLEDEVEKTIEQANQRFRDKNAGAAVPPPVPLPLIRLKVEFTGGFEIENTRRFSNRFVGKVANTNDIIQFYKRRTAAKKAVDLGGTSAKDVVPSAPTKDIRLEDILHDFLEETELALIPENGMEFAVKKYLQTEDKHVLESYINQEIKTESAQLMNLDIDVEEFHRDEAHTRTVFKQVLKQVKQENKRKDFSQVDPEQPTTADTPKPRGRAKATPKKKAPAKSSSRVVSSDDEDVEILSESDIEEVVPQPKRRGTKRK
ncbi:double-strand break repair protein Mre11p [Diutina catenulata]